MKYPFHFGTGISFVRQGESKGTAQTQTFTRPGEVGLCVLLVRMCFDV